MLGWGLGTETQAPEVIPSEKTEAGCVQQPEGLSSSASWAEERNATTEGTWEKVWTRRRGRVLLLGRARGGEVDHHRKLPAPEHAHVPGSQGRAVLAQATRM